MAWGQDVIMSTTKVSYQTKVGKVVNNGHLLSIEVKMMNESGSFGTLVVVIVVPGATFTPTRPPSNSSPVSLQGERKESVRQ